VAEEARYQPVVQAIRQLRSNIEWKPGKDVQHLRTRISYGHLPGSSTMSDYEDIIRSIICDDLSEVYIYSWKTDVYPTVVGEYVGERWLVMLGLDGQMETAFPPTDAREYLSNPHFEKLGLLGELLR
jgi:hypothetical protein